MSLINDALKRAKQAQQKNPEQPPPPPEVPMRPVETPAKPAPPTRSLLFPILVAFVLMMIGTVVIMFAIKRGGSKTEAPIANRSVAPTVNSSQATPVAPAAQPPTTVDRTTNVATAIAPHPAPISSNPVPIVASTVVTQTIAAVERTATNAAAPAIPKLQGILYNPARPTAFLNGKSYLIGGRVGEFTVVGITKESVTVERAGQTNVLTMEE